MHDKTGMNVAARYHRYRLPLLRCLLDAVYWLERVSVQRVWHVRRALADILGGRGAEFSLLDLGCGLGDYIFTFAPRFPRARFVGVDHMSDNVAICRAYQELHRLDNVAFVASDICAETTLEPVDVVLLITVLQYVDDPVMPLRRARAMLHANGRLLLFQDVYASIEKEPGAAEAGVRDHHRQYTPAQILAALEQAGFIIERHQFCQGRAATRVDALVRRVLFSVKRKTLTGFAGVLLLTLASPLLLAVLWADSRRSLTSGSGLLIVARV